jgi:hypothetical protein
VLKRFVVEGLCSSLKTKDVNSEISAVVRTSGSKSSMRESVG